MNKSEKFDCSYELTDKQRSFVRSAKKQGHVIDFNYSGRFMFGRMCPAVRVKYLDDFKGYNKYNRDQMGLGMIVYCS
jgi:hypothetical protein